MFGRERLPLQPERRVSIPGHAWTRPEFSLSSITTQHSQPTHAPRRYFSSWRGSFQFFPSSCLWAEHRSYFGSFRPTRDIVGEQAIIISCCITTSYLINCYRTTFSTKTCYIMTRYIITYHIVTSCTPYLLWRRKPKAIAKVQMHRMSWIYTRDLSDVWLSGLSTLLWGTPNVTALSVGH